MTDTFNTPNDDEINLLDLLLVVVQNLRLLVLGPVVIGLLALGVAYLLSPWYESKAIQSGACLISFAFAQQDGGALLAQPFHVLNAQ